METSGGDKVLAAETNAAALEKGDQTDAKPIADSIAEIGSDQKKTLAPISITNEGALEKKQEASTSIRAKSIEKTPNSRDTTEKTTNFDDTKTSSAAAQPPQLSLLNNIQGVETLKNQNRSTQQLMHQHRHEQHSTSSPSLHQENPPSLTRKRARQEPSSPPTQTEQPQIVTKKTIDYRNIRHLWKRYNLAAIEMSSVHETAELRAVETQTWKRKKFVPYNGLSSNLD